MARSDMHISWLPRTLPVRSMDDLAPYHWVKDEKGGLHLRKGMPPAAVVKATEDMAEGKITLNEYLDLIGVPKS